jgi:hypothetical protein
MGTSVRISKQITEFGPDSKELKRLRSFHSVYGLYVAHWDICLAAYEGGPDFAKEGNIWRHFRENEDDYRDRVKRLHYINYCEQIVDFYTNFIFSETIDRNGGSNAAWYEEFVKNVDNKGTNLNSYMKKVSDETQIFGMCYTLVDAPPVPEGVLTKQQEKEQNIRPYWCFLRPEEVVDWVTDDFDNFTYLKRREIISRVDSDKEIHTLERYTEFYPDRFVQTAVDITDPAKPMVGQPSTIVNALGLIPIYVHRYKRSKRYPYMGNSFLRDFAYNSREIMNLTSLLQEFLYRQCFNLLVKEVESQVPITSQQDGLLGTANVLEYPKNANAPAYISPPADPAKFIQSERASIKEEMFRRASQDSMQELFNGGAASGFSKTQSFSKTVPFIAARAEVLEVSENALMQLTLARISKNWDGKIKYKDHYEITNITDAMTQFVMITRDMLMPSETFDKEQLKRFVNEFDGKLQPDIRNKINQEIETMDYDKWKEVQKEALIGAPKSPAAQQKPKSTGTVAEVKAEAKTNGGAATKKLQ